MNHPEHARTGTSAVGGSRQAATSLRRGRGRPAPPTELVIVDLITQHNEQPHEELAGDGDFGFGASAAMHERDDDCPLEAELPQAESWPGAKPALPL